CLLIEHESGLVLIDTGAGNKENDKFHDIYGVENRGADGGTQLEDGLRQLGVRPADVSIVINSHLHFDHAGGNTPRTADGKMVPTSAHLPLPWIMGYDVEPLVTLETKRRVLGRAVAENWLIVFEHDAKVAWSRIGHDGKSFVLT